MSGELIVGLGLCTPVGTSAEMTAASTRAGITRFRDVEVPGGDRIRAARLTTLDPSLPRAERMVALGRAALADVSDLIARAHPARPALYLGLPEPGLGAPVDARRLAFAIQEAAGIGLASAHEGGRAGFFEALAAARADLRAGRRGAVLVGAVDSLADGASLRTLADARLVLGADNNDGRIPGEAAGFALVTRSGGAEALGVAPLAMVLGTALGAERAPFASRAPSFSEGLTEVFRALGGDPLAGARRADHVLGCQPGESFWATEFSRAYLRNAALMPEPLTVRMAGESVGDAGAGAGPVVLGEALARMRRRPGGGGHFGRALLYGSADGGRIGGCVVESVSEG